MRKIILVCMLGSSCLVCPGSGFCLDFGDYHMEGCDIYFSKGGSRSYVAGFPKVYDETLENYGIKIDPYHDGRNNFGCRTSITFAEYGGKYWFYISNSLNREDVGEDYFSGFAYFDPKSQQTGILRVPALLNCSVDYFKVSSSTLYAQSSIPGWDYGAKCIGIIGLDLAKNELKNYYPDSPLRDLEINHFNIWKNPSAHKPEGDVYPDGLKKKIGEVGLSEYMHRQVLLETAVEQKVLSTASEIQSSKCRISESNATCMYSGINNNFKITGEVASLKGCSQKGILLVNTPYGLILPPENDITGKAGPSPVYLRPLNNKDDLLKLSFSDYKAFWTACPGRQEKIKTFLYLNISIRELEIGGTDTVERRNKYVIGLRDLPSEIALPEPYREQYLNYLTVSTPSYTPEMLLSGLRDENRDAFMAAMITALKVDKKSVRHRAENFFKANIGTLLPYIVKEIDNPSKYVKEAAIVLVRDQGEKIRGLIPRLINNLGSEDETISRSSAWTLQHLGIDCKEELLSALGDKNVEDKSKVSIVAILGEEKYSAVRSRLLELAGNDTPLGHIAAATYLYLFPQTISDKTVPLFVTALKYQRMDSVGYQGATYAAEQLPQLRTEGVVDSLLPLLSSTDREVQLKSARLFGGYTEFSSKIVPQLEPLLQGNDVEISEAAALSIAKLMPENKAAITALIKFAQVPDWPEDIVNPRNSIVALGEMRAKQSIPVLKSLLQSDNYNNSYEIACALSKVSPESSDTYMHYMVRALDFEYIGGAYKFDALKCLVSAGKYAKAALSDLKSRLEKATDAKSREAYTETIKAIEGDGK